MIFYFSGTGNSRYVARQLADLMGDSVCDIASYTRSAAGDTFRDDRPFVFVAPVYVAAPALSLLEFLKKSCFQGSRKAYFVMTCAGTMSGSPAFCRKAAEELGLEYMGTASVKLPQNYIAYFSMKSAEENRKIIDAAQPVIGALARDILEGRPFTDPKINKLEYASTLLILKPYYRWFITAKKFRVEDSCIGCGKCEKLCPLGNIRMEAGLPHWGDHCTHCMACINFCPKDAIEYGKGSVGKLRYRGPEQTLKQTDGAKHRN
jgi:ferredoxin